MAESVDTNGDPVPEVLFEAFFKTNNGNMVHVRVHGNQFEFDVLLGRFKMLCEQYKYASRGITYG